MKAHILLSKLKRRLRSSVIKTTAGKRVYPLFYMAYWHARFYRPKSNVEGNYFSAIPNPGAGIGHQIANWIAGFWYAKQFGLKFAHIPFSSQQWDNVLGFGDNEVLVEDLIRKKGYKKIRLPLFNEDKKCDLNLIRKIVTSYRDQQVVFICEQDQAYRDQFGVQEDIKQKFFMAKERENEKLVFSESDFNIAVHVRRGDIIPQKNVDNPNLQMRWQDNTYFETVLSTIVDNLLINKTINIYLFSQGERSDFAVFEKFKNINYCLDMSAHDSFVHMAYADLLITSKSSFSYKPALLNKGIKVCPINFWHGYPGSKEWILVDEKGGFDVKRLQALSKSVVDLQNE
ncbi:hypothetical protein [Saccharicrinis sp. 156]|uniref:hypothetical protein n=1 Tax=Saccharicrinis sp. 156 TaxID=3417574 RepID=UPI003D32ED36